MQDLWSIKDTQSGQDKVSWRKLEALRKTVSNKTIEWMETASNQTTVKLWPEKDMQNDWCASLS